MQNIKILSQKNLFERFNRITEYELQVPSLKNPSHYNGAIKREIVECSDAVIILIYAPDIDSFIMCKEFRAGVFCNSQTADPFIIECPAGMIDRDASPEEIAHAEVQEETGLTPGDLHLITTVYSSPGRITEKVHVFYTEVPGHPQTGTHGLASENEEITTMIIKREKIYQMLNNGEILDSMTFLALSWFRANKG